MKAEHRKELGTNVLADRLGRAYAGLKHGPSRGTVFYFALALVAVLIGGAWWWFSSTSARDSSDRWVRFDQLVFPEQLDDFLGKDDIKDTPQARLANFLKARQELREGLSRLGSDRQEGLERVKRGTALYEELLKERGQVPPLQQEALWGAAKGNEALGKRDRAEGFYERLTKEFPDSALAKDAERQLKRLRDDANRQELDELATAYGEKSE
jgi:hypothetical protein